MVDVLWFRRDLRAEDNTVLAVARDAVLPIFILDSRILEPLKPSDPRKGMLYHYVIRLKRQLKKAGLDLQIFRGDPLDVLTWLKGRMPIKRVLAAVDYDGYARKRDRQVAELVPLETLEDCYLLPPEVPRTGSGDPYRVFTPFYKSARSELTPRMLGERIMAEGLRRYPSDYEFCLDIRGDGVKKLPLEPDMLGCPDAPDSDAPAMGTPESLLKRLGPLVADYAVKRDFPALDHTSRLGPHLRFGTLSVRRVMRWLDEREAEGTPVEPFRRQLFWREFYGHVLYHFPDSETSNFQRISIPWKTDKDAFRQWASGETGVPIVDAGMRQLNRTGYMHNRSRMIVSSFLVKDLHMDWRKGEAYFAEHLLDYDASANVGSWQWSASTGTDAQPYFRVFNPWRQAARFDPEGSYIRNWVPEVRDVPLKKLHDERFFRDEGITGYPRPMVLHTEAAEEAVAMFKAAKNR